MALTKAHNRVIAGSHTKFIDFGAVGDGVTDDRNAIIAALASVAGSEGSGYGAAPAVVDLGGKVYGFTGKIFVPSNVILQNGEFLGLSSTYTDDRIIWRYSAWTYNGGHTQTEYLKYSTAKVNNVKFQCMAVINGYIELYCSQCVFNGLVIVNGGGRWTEYSTFHQCHFFPQGGVGGFAILFRADDTASTEWDESGSGSAGTNSFGHTQFSNCAVSVGEDQSGLLMESGNLYDGIINFSGSGNFDDSRFIYLNGGGLQQSIINLVIETQGASAKVISITASPQGRFRYNLGSIISISPEATFFQGVGSSVTANWINVFGCVLQDEAGSDISQGHQRPSAINGDLLKRVQLSFDTTRLATESFQSEKGVYIGSSAVDANLLDDYEEGTWTPSLSATSLGFSSHSSERGGYYTKIGNVVTATGIFGGDPFGTGANDLSLTLPVAAKNVNSDGQAGSLVISYVDNWGSSPTGGYVVDNTNTVALFNGTTRLQSSDITNVADGGFIVFSITYLTD